MTHATATQRCPLTVAVQAVGGRWHLIVLHLLSERPRHFNDLQRSAEGISHKVLTETLRHLATYELVERETVAGAVPRVEYSLSDHGRRILPALTALVDWGTDLMHADGELTASHPAV